MGGERLSMWRTGNKRFVVVVTVQLTSVGLLQDGLVDVLRDERVVCEWVNDDVEHDRRNVVIRGGKGTLGSSDKLNLVEGRFVHERGQNLPEGGEHARRVDRERNAQSLW